MLKPLEKEMSKEMYFEVFYALELKFGEVEINHYHIVRVFTVSEVVKLKKDNNMNNSLLFRIFKKNNCAK